MDFCGTGGRFVVGGTPVFWSLKYASGLKDYQIVGVPGWLTAFDSAYDIEAKPARPVDNAECRLMLQSLFADRFKLAVHHEMNQSTVYLLKIGKKGPKLPQGGGVKLNESVQMAGLLNFRQARKVARGVIDAWKAALATGESVRTPAGVLLVRTLRSGRRIALRPAAQLRLAIETERTPKIASMPSIQNGESPLQCSRCGSQWFAEHEYRQYANQSYQSAISGPMVAMSDPQLARVCPCGMPFRPKRALRGRLLASADQSFLESWERVRKYLRLQSDAEERVGKRLREVVNAEFVQQLLARVESAEQEIVRLTAELQARHLKPRKKAPRRP